MSAISDERPLRERAAASAERAAALLGDPRLDAAEPRDLIERLSARLAELGAGRSEELREQLAARDRLHQRYARRFEALEAARGAVDQLRELTAPQAIVDQAPAALCRASAFRRALLSVVGEGRMQPQAAHFRDDPAGAQAALGRLRERPIALEHPLVEAELLRRRRATIVAATAHRRVDPTLRGVMGWRSYAAAPLISGAALIGVIHADRGPGTDLDVLDRDVLWVFTSALGQTYESAVLRRQLRQEREQLRGFLDWLGARSGELADAPVRLSTFSRAPRRPLPELDAAPLAGRRDDRAVFDGLLTRRELEVLRLLAEGRSNRAIAEELVIAPGTVKFHVNRILRKLRVSNRSQAVARYLQLLGLTGPERTAPTRPRT